MKKIWMISGCFLLCINGLFGASIKGVVYSGADRSPIPSVNVYINELLGTSTGANGRFFLDEISEGSHTVTISFIGYQTQVKSIEVKETSATIEFGTIWLKEKATAIDEVLIQHTVSNYRSKYIGSNNFISTEALNTLKPMGTEEILRSVPGVNIEGDMGISNRLNVGIRGSYPRRSDKVLILEDGSPVAPAPYLSPSAYYNPPPERLDGIEVIKGSDVLTYGGNTMYGVINYITKRPPVKPRLSVDLKGGMHKFYSQYLTYGGTWKNTGAEVQFLHKSFDGFIDNSGTEIYNVTAKVFSELDERQSIYLKLNYHNENSKATYSGITPLTFRLDPKQNPFDADDLNSSRMALDFVYKLELMPNFVLSSKVYAHQFKRDWWRQNTTLIQASKAKHYLGDEIFHDRYQYLQGVTLGPDDFVRVGKIINGREQTKARNRNYKVAGIQETLKHSWSNAQYENDVEIGIRYHKELFYNQEITGDSSRFARSGNLILDEQFELDAASAFVKNTFRSGKFSIVPTVRYEYITMTQTDLLKIAVDPGNNGDEDFARIRNSFSSIIPGVGIQYQLIEKEPAQIALLAGAYKGYTPPTSSFGFLSVTDDQVSKPGAADHINIKAETSTNFEAGIRGSVLHQKLSGQIVYFNNHIKNFYAAGRKEAFQTLGSVNVQGLEIGLSYDPFNIGLHSNKFTINTSLTLLSSRITGGKLSDGDVLAAKHTDASRAELIDLINEQRSGFVTYFENDSLIDRILTVQDFDKLDQIEMTFGKDGISGNRAPYTPEYMLNIGISYAYKGLKLNGMVHFVGSQFTEYLNLRNETSDGAMGALSDYHTIDLSASYSFMNSKSKLLNSLSIYLAAKNIMNDVYASSRLHRVSSGIMPGGFRQINGGLKFSL